ncbi:MAG: histidine phosphatase family protein [Pyrinomonadaceae bacterium]
MAATRLYLVRHGQSGGNVEGRFGGHSDTPLSGLGEKQAELTADVLSAKNIAAIYTSDLRRAVQTAEPLERRSGIKITRTSAFRERHVGVLEGLTFAESKEQYPTDYYALVNREVNHVITGGESYRQLLRRATSALKEVLYAHRGEQVVVYSHTGTICFLSLYLMGAIRKTTRFTPWIVTSNCGINLFEIRGSRNTRVLSINDTRHLSDITGNDSFSDPKS